MLSVCPSRQSAFLVGITLLSFAACSASTDGGGTSTPNDATSATNGLAGTPPSDASHVVRITLAGPSTDDREARAPLASHTASGVAIQRPAGQSGDAAGGTSSPGNVPPVASTPERNDPARLEPRGATKAIAAAASAASPKATTAAATATDQPVAASPSKPASTAVSAAPAMPAETAAERGAAATVAAPPTPRNASVIMPTVRIEGGVFDEEPIAGFELDQTEVTVAMYAACVQAGRCTPPAPAEDGKIGRAQCTYGRAGLEVTPVNCVTPLDADAFCAYAGKRLPSEEEWEWAAAGREDDRRFVWGSGYGIPEGVCWKRKAEGPCDVGTSPADVTRDGVKDMAGNVQEWTTSTLEGRRVGRGGSWFADFGVALQIATFVSGDGGSRSDLVGFRCARSLD